ncbi:MAG TPA: hypothetical protein VK465_07005 [Fibrobacteria bacterium]|nr:hypothetical protein [Geothrix sp.]HLP41239.1 hypothetical protein [Fibrobacteria bacterium]
MTKEAREKFLARWIPWGMAKLARAEAYGIPWERIPLEQLDDHIHLAEEFATPDEYKTKEARTTQKRARA